MLRSRTPQERNEKLRFPNGTKSHCFLNDARNFKSFKSMITNEKPILKSFKGEHKRRAVLKNGFICFSRPSTYFGYTIFYNS